MSQPEIRFNATSFLHLTLEKLLNPECGSTENETAEYVIDVLKAYLQMHPPPQNDVSNQFKNFVIALENRNLITSTSKVNDELQNRVNEIFQKCDMLLFVIGLCSHNVSLSVHRVSTSGGVTIVHVILTNTGLCRNINFDNNFLVYACTWNLELLSALQNILHECQNTGEMFGNLPKHERNQASFEALYTSINNNLERLEGSSLQNINWEGVLAIQLMCTKKWQTFVDVIVQTKILLESLENVQDDTFISLLSDQINKLNRNQQLMHFIGIENGKIDDTSFVQNNAQLLFVFQFRSPFSLWSSVVTYLNLKNTNPAQHQSFALQTTTSIEKSVEHIRSQMAPIFNLIDKDPTCERLKNECNNNPSLFVQPLSNLAWFTHALYEPVLFQPSRLLAESNHFHSNFIDVLNHSAFEVHIGFSGTMNIVIPSSSSFQHNYKGTTGIIDTNIYDTPMVNQYFIDKNVQVNEAPVLSLINKTTREQIFHIVVKSSCDIDEGILNVLTRNQCRALIDSCAVFRMISNREIVRMLNQAFENAGIRSLNFVYFDSVSHQARVFNKNEVSSQEDRLLNSITPSSEFVQSLFLFYDQQHTVGTDLERYQAHHMKGLCLVNSSSRMTDVSQAMYRLRNLNNGHLVEFAFIEFPENKDSNQPQSGSDLILHFQKNEMQSTHTMLPHHFVQNAKSMVKFDKNSSKLGILSEQVKETFLHVDQTLVHSEIENKQVYNGNLPTLILDRLKEMREFENELRTVSIPTTCVETQRQTQTVVQKTLNADNQYYLVGTFQYQPLDYSDTMQQLYQTTDVKNPFASENVNNNVFFTNLVFENIGSDFITSFGSINDGHVNMKRFSSVSNDVMYTESKSMYTCVTPDFSDDWDLSCEQRILMYNHRRNFLHFEVPFVFVLTVELSSQSVKRLYILYYTEVLKVMNALMTSFENKSEFLIVLDGRLNLVPRFANNSFKTTIDEILSKSHLWVSAWLFMFVKTTSLDIRTELILTRHFLQYVGLCGKDKDKINKNDDVAGRFMLDNFTALYLLTHRHLPFQTYFRNVFFQFIPESLFLQLLPKPILSASQTQIPKKEMSLHDYNTWSSEKIQITYITIPKPKPKSKPNDLACFHMTWYDFFNQRSNSAASFASESFGQVRNVLSRSLTFNEDYHQKRERKTHSSKSRTKSKKKDKHSQRSNHSMQSRS